MTLITGSDTETTINPSTKKFFEIYVQFHPDKLVTLGDLYKRYSVFCVGVLNKPPQSKRAFSKDVREMLQEELHTGQVVIDNRSAVILKGLMLIE